MIERYTLPKIGKFFTTKINNFQNLFTKKIVSAQEKESTF